MKRCDSVAFGLLSFPVASAALAMAGFAFGIPVGLWHAPIALAFAVMATWWLAGPGKVNAVWWLLVGLATAFALASLNVGYTNADAAVYQRPATILLANGWNPLRQTEIDEIQGIMGGGFRVWHVAFLPRLAWLFGAACYRWSGFAEISDAFNFVLLFASMLALREWLGDKFELCGWRRWALVLAFAFSPVVVGGLFGGAYDSGGYSAFIVAMTAADRKKFPLLISAVVSMAGLKFTGAVVGALIFAVFASFDFVPSAECWRKLKQWVMSGVTAGMLILLVNASPYITSSINHGGPFYPSHSFVAEERFEDEKNPITYDFGYMNDDAKELGYFGRFAWGYVSQDLVRAYYAHKTGRADFNPDFRVSGGVGGFGGFFRCLFVVSLLGWCFVRNRSIHAWLSLIMVSVLIQPTFYSGYARYVPQFYLFPWLVALGLFERFRGSNVYRWTGWVGWGVFGAYAASILAYPASFFALQWIIVTQNLQIILAAKDDDAAVVVSPKLYMRTAYGRDAGIPENRVFVKAEKSCIDGKNEYCSYFSFGSCWLSHPIEGFHSLCHVISLNDPAVKASRNSANIKFFLKEFLPYELPRIPLRIWQTIRLRASQCLPTSAANH